MLVQSEPFNTQSMIRTLAQANAEVRERAPLTSAPLDFWWTYSISVVNIRGPPDRREISRYNAYHEKIKGDEWEEWQVKVGALLCMHSIRHKTVYQCKSSVAMRSCWSVNSQLSVCALNIVNITTSSLNICNTFPSTGTVIHHGEHIIKKWQRGGTGQNNFIWKGAKWDYIQNPCSDLSAAQSHLPCFCREENNTFWPWCQNTCYEKRNTERGWICSGY